MAILWLFDTCGFIIGPLMWLAGFIAIGYCIRATRTALPAHRSFAIKISLAPLAIGVIGMIWGLVMLTTVPIPNLTEALLNIGKVGLAGLVVTAIPFVWSLMLPRPEPEPLPNIA